jgi:hypothetical protein
MVMMMMFGGFEPKTLSSQRFLIVLNRKHSFSVVFLFFLTIFRREPFLAVSGPADLAIAPATGYGDFFFFVFELLEHYC